MLFCGALARLRQERVDHPPELATCEHGEQACSLTTYQSRRQEEAEEGQDGEANEPAAYPPSTDIPRLMVLHVLGVCWFRVVVLALVMVFPCSGSSTARPWSLSGLLRCTGRAVQRYTCRVEHAV